MTTYTYKVDGLIKKNLASLQNVVCQVSWAILAVNDAGFTGHQPRTTEFNPEAVDAENFVVYDELTEEEVIQWCLASMSEADIAQSRTQIEQQITDREQASLRIGPGSFPWSP